ncbi:MAG: class I SAM-dependent methyltransferase [Candidatus Sumerlaeia bacterium]|nr:class I SAM-dependent methyltransferase [Candidatus Sumerlaeia bacterium]
MNEFTDSRLKTINKVENEHFWFKTRRKFIISVAKKIIPDDHFTYLEIGCGTGSVLSEWQKKFKNAECFGCDLSLSAMQLTKNAGFMAICADANNLPFRESFDVVGVYDVLEHLIDDRLILEEIKGSLKPGGIFIITVPAGQYLMTEYDKAAGHLRRYTRKSMTALIANSNFKLVFCSYFFGFILPFIFVKRKIFDRFGQRKKEEEMIVNAELKLPPKLINCFLKILTDIEFWLRRYLNLPWGSSLIIIARKQINSEER